MLQNDQAVAYAHVVEASDKFGELLTVIWDALLREDMIIVKKIARQLAEAKKVLEP